MNITRTFQSLHNSSFNKNELTNQNSINKNSVSFKGGGAAAAVIYGYAREAERHRRDEYEREQRRYDEMKRQEELERQRKEEYQQRMSELRNAKDREQLDELKSAYLDETILPAIKKIDKNLNGKISTHFVGNKLTLTYKDQDKEVELPEDFLNKDMSDKEKELLVKSWLYESRRFKDFDNIPVELLECARDLGFYDDDTLMRVESFLHADKIAKENGVNVRQFINKGGYNRELHVEVNDVPYVIDLGARHSYDSLGAFNKSDFVIGAIYSKEDLKKEHIYNGSSSAQAGVILQNIKDTLCGKFVTEDRTDIFIPNLLNGRPTFKNKTLLKYGNVENANNYDTSRIVEILNVRNINASEDDLKQIDYTESFKEKKTAYSYYDKLNDRYYLYLSQPDAEHYGIIMKEDKFGRLYQIKLPYTNGYINENEFHKQDWELAE